jgi:hypothetical protein
MKPSDQLLEWFIEDQEKLNRQFEQTDPLSDKLIALCDEYLKKSVKKRTCLKLFFQQLLMRVPKFSAFNLLKIFSISAVFYIGNYLTVPYSHQGINWLEYFLLQGKPEVSVLHGANQFAKTDVTYLLYTTDYRMMVGAQKGLDELKKVYPSIKETWNYSEYSGIFGGAVHFYGEVKIPQSELDRIGRKINLGLAIKEVDTNTAALIAYENSEALNFWQPPNPNAIRLEKGVQPQQ